MREHQDAVRLHDRVQAMRDSYDRGVFELLLDQSLDHLLSLDVDIGSCFIEHNNLVFAQDSATDADQLPLSRAQV